ncbi:MAG TPA: secretin N-terminal domain-containing protein [Phycisphaerales bacterium]
MRRTPIAAGSHDVLDERWTRWGVLALIAGSCVSIPVLTSAQPASSQPAAAPAAQPAMPTITTERTTISVPNTPGAPADAAAAPAADKDKNPIGPGQAFAEVRVSPYFLVDIVAQNASLVGILQKLAIQSRRNIVSAKAVDTPISATIYAVPFETALNALLKPQGLGFIERDGVLYVYPQNEIDRLSAADRGVVSKVIRLNYITAEDAAEFAKDALSPNGRVKATSDGGGKEGGGSGGASGGSSGGGSGGESGGGSGGIVASSDGVYSPDTEKFALSNAIVVTDHPENVAAVEAMIAEIEEQPIQVLLEATIVQTKLTEANAFGVDFALLNDIQFTDFFKFPSTFNPLGFTSPSGQSTGTASTSPRNNSFLSVTPGNTGPGKGNIKGGIVAGDAGVFIRALDEVTDVSLLSNPKVLSLNRQRARVNVGVRVGYLETTATQVAVTQTIKFLDTGITLDVRPFVMEDGQVRLRLSPKVSAVTFRTITDSQGRTQQIPDEEIQMVTADVLVPNGSTAVLGGLFREDITNLRSQVPGVGDIPLIGAAFQGRDNTVNRSEIIFLIKPTVLSSKQVDEQGSKAVGYSQRVRTGSRLGLLPWSRERQSAQLNVDALHLAGEGRVDDALWRLRRSLELNPAQPDAIRIRENLMGGQMWWPSRNLMNDAVNDELDRAFPTLTNVSPSLFFPGEKRRSAPAADPLLPPRKVEAAPAPSPQPNPEPQAEPAAEPKP